MQAPEVQNYSLSKASETWERESKVVGLKFNASKQQMCKILGTDSVVETV